jgi:hypothetical protein
MRLLKLSARQLADLAVANTKVRNVILVPFCVEGRAGVFVEADHLEDEPVIERIHPDDHAKFFRHREMLGKIVSKDIVVASEIPDRKAREVEAIEAEAIEAEAIEAPVVERKR